MYQTLLWVSVFLVPVRLSSRPSWSIDFGDVSQTEVELLTIAGSSIPPVFILNANNFVHITQHATGDAN